MPIHVLLLAGPVVLDWGITTSPTFARLPCALSQDVARFSLAVPPGAPIGVTFRIRSLGAGNSGVLALGPRS